MAKEFHAWLAAQANSIEDASEFVKPTLNYHLRTNLQKRMLFADTLVRHPSTTETIKDWLLVLCTSISGDSGSKFLGRLPLNEIIGKELEKEYNNLINEFAHILWYQKLRAKIATNWQPTSEEC